MTIHQNFYLIKTKKTIYKGYARRAWPNKVKSLLKSEQKLGVIRIANNETAFLVFPKLF